WKRPTVVAMTTAARAACGISATSGARNSSVARTPAAVTSAATWVRAPATLLTAVWEAPPPEGMFWNALPARFVRARAMSSRFGVGTGSPGRTERAPHRDGLHEAHERDAEGGWPDVKAERHVGQREPRKSRPDLTDQRHPEPVESEEPGSGDAHHDRDE